MPTVGVICGVQLCRSNATLVDGGSFPELIKKIATVLSDAYGTVEKIAEPVIKRFISTYDFFVSIYQNYF